MVGLNPVLKCVMTVEEGLARGEAVRGTLLAWLDRDPRSNHVFRGEMLEFLRTTENADGENFLGGVAQMRFETIYRRSLFDLLADGMLGNPILPRLRELRLEIESQLELDMKAHVESLPLKMLVPLLLVMFPAFLILLLGPITQNFMEALR